MDRLHRQARARLNRFGSHLGKMPIPEEWLEEWLAELRAIKVTPEDRVKTSKLNEEIMFDIRAGINRDPDQRLN